MNDNAIYSWWYHNVAVQSRIFYGDPSPIKPGNRALEGWLRVGRIADRVAVLQQR
jgi:hypothetical protein